MPLRAVHRFKADRRAYEDIKPRIRRTTAGLMPADVLMADATKLDIAMAREDGSIYFPPCMLWMDLATRYVWVFLYFPDKGKGLANVHGIETFLSVVEELGCPKSIYADNGPEYNFTTFIDDAMKLVDDHGRPLMRFDLLGKSVRKSNTINSIPHNPQGKAPVEGWFGLWRHSLKGIQGYVGGDRTKMHTPNVGRKAEVFPGTPEQLSAVIGQTVGLYNTTPQRGDLKGKSPREVWENAIADGWQKTAVNPDAMRVAFSNEVPRVVRQGCFRHDNRLWSCPELQAYQGHNISVRVPKYGDWSRLPVFAEGKLLGVATPERAFDVLDPDGAREAHRRQKLHRDGLRRLASSVPDLDVINERAATLAELGAMPSAPVLRILQPSDKGAEVLEALSETEEQRDRRHHDEWERELQARQRMLDEDRERRERDAV